MADARGRACNLCRTTWTRKPPFARKPLRCMHYATFCVLLSRFDPSPDWPTGTYDVTCYEGPDGTGRTRMTTRNWESAVEDFAYMCRSTVDLISSG